MSNVVGLRGREIIDERQPLEDVIQKARKILTMAESGEINGLAAVVHYHDEATGTFRGGMAAYAMVGRMEVVKQAMLRALEAA